MASIPPTNVLVASVSILRDGQVLIIQENKPIARNVWNFPSGRIEPGEDIQDAARREVKEETGYEVRLTATTGIYNFISSVGNQVILFHFTGEIVGGALQLEEHVITGSRWVNPSDLLVPGFIELREAELMKQIAANLVHTKLYSLEIFNAKLEK